MRRKGSTDAAVKFEDFGAKEITAESLSIRKGLRESRKYGKKDRLGGLGSAERQN